MDNIFAGLYNKVLGFFRQTETETENSAKEVACNRLRVVLMQDRTNLTPELMERMRKEMVELLSKYVEMDKEALELNLAHDGDQVALMLSIPVLRAKDEEEIEKALAEADAKSENSKEDEITDADENLEEDEAAEEGESEEELKEEDLNTEEDEATEETLDEEVSETEEPKVNAEKSSETKKPNKSK